MAYDDVYDYTGHMGRFQWAVFACMWTLSVFLMEGVNMIFIGVETDHWCRVDALSSLPPERQRYFAIPPRKTDSPQTTCDGNSSTTSADYYSQCEMFALNWTDFNRSDFACDRWDWQGIRNTTGVVQCERWNYDTSFYGPTIISRFGLVCGKEYLVETVTSVYMIGVLLGTFTSGAISDRFGRKISLIIWLIVKSVGSVLSTFAADYWTFLAGRFVMGVGTIGCFLTVFVIVMEMVGPKWRTQIGVNIQMSLSVGFMMTGVAAYYVRDDFYLQLITMGPIILFVPVAFLIPESPRWLIVRGRYDDAKRVLQQICYVNGTKFPDEIDLRELEKEIEASEKNCLALMKTPGMRIRSLITYSSWFTCALVYYALSMFSSYLAMSTSLHVNTIISGAVEIPINVLTMYLMDWKPLGRRGTGCLSLIGAGLMSFLCALVTMFEYDTAAMALSLIAKGFITMAYTNAYLFGSEVFPTEVRNVGVGVASMAESAGSIIAPFMGGPLADVWTPLPSIVYAVLACLCGFSYFFLPETFGQPLLDTIEQADELDKKRRHISLFGCRNVDKNGESSSKDGLRPATTVPLRAAERATNGHVQTSKNNCDELDDLFIDEDVEMKLQRIVHDSNRAFL